MFNPKFVALAILLAAQALPALAEESAPAATTTPAPAVAQPVAPAPQARPKVAVNTDAPAARPAAPEKKVDQEKSLWNNWLPIPDLKFEGF